MGQLKNSNAGSRADTEPPRYMSYLIRMWCAEECESTLWRASLEDPHSGERFGFASPEELFSFLIEKVEGRARREPGRPDQGGVDE